MLSTVVLFRNQAVYLKINIRFQSLLALAPLFFYSLFSFHSAFEQVPPVVSFRAYCPHNLCDVINDDDSKLRGDYRVVGPFCHRV